MESVPGKRNGDCWLQGSEDKCSDSVGRARNTYMSLFFTCDVKAFWKLGKGCLGRMELNVLVLSSSSFQDLNAVSPYFSDWKVAYLCCWAFGE